MIKVKDNIFVYENHFKKNYFLKDLLCEMNNIQNNFPVINVVGTNGKGSVSGYISQGLKAKYKKVGLFVSPAFRYHNERIQINNEPISDSDLLRIIKESTKQINDYKLSFFEIWTLIAIKYFFENKVDIAVIEAGIGGKLDSTNVFEYQKAVAITSIDLDHTEILGKTIDEIIYQKSGIVKKDVNIFLANDNIKYKNIFEKYLTKNLMHFSKFSENKIGYQNINFGLACSVLDHLEVNYENEFNFTEPLGRLTIMQKDPLIILDGCHNVDGVRKMIDSVKIFNKNFKILFATSINKDYKEMIKLLSNEFSEVYFTEFEDNKSWKIPDSIKEKKVLNWKNFVLDYKKSDLIICGSLYFIPLVYDFLR